MVNQVPQLRDYVDLSALHITQQKQVEAALHALMRSATFMQVMERMREKYGQIIVTQDPHLDTIANQTVSPPQLNINLAQIETSGYVQTLADGGREARPMTLQRVLAHEIAHFAQDKRTLKEQMMRRFAGLVQEALNDYMASFEQMTAEIQRDYPHFVAFFGYENEQHLLEAMANMQPLSRQAYIEHTEVPAMRLENVIMKEAYAEVEREASAQAYVASVVRRDEGFRCALDTVTVVDESYPGVSEPCAYGYIPGRQESAIPSR